MAVFLQTGSSSFCQNLVESYVLPIREKTPVYFFSKAVLDLIWSLVICANCNERIHSCESHLKPTSCHGAKGTKSNNKVTELCTKCNALAPGGPSLMAAKKISNRFPIINIPLNQCDQCVLCKCNELAQLLLCALAPSSIAPPLSGCHSVPTFLSKLVPLLAIKSLCSPISPNQECAIRT